MRGRRSVIEHMTEVAAAPAAVLLGASHAVASVARGLNRVRNRLVEAGPAGAAFELGLGHEQGLPASGAGKCAGTFLVIEGATPRRFGAVPPHHFILLGGEQR